MNHTYRLVWNQESQRYVPAPECAKGKSKTKTNKALAPAAIVLSAAFAMPAWAQAPPANALPTGGKVTAGQAAISQNGSQMTVNQGSQKAIIDWTSFNIGKNAGVTFNQNNSSAIALNRVTAGDASQIHGQLNANGQVWLINPKGVVFGAGSKVDVGGLVATTMNIANDDFLNGNYQFSRNGATGSITNLGELTAKDGGYIALLAPTVSNDGVITAQLGTVAMAAGDKITLQAGANGLLNVEIDPATIQTLIENKQLIVADGGQVIMTGKAADQLAASVVSNSGTIQANTLQEKDGKILLLADMQHGETQAAGTLEAKFIDTSAATVSIDKDLKINTAGGEWLIDPVDITIDAAKATAIQTALGTGDVTVSTENEATNPWGDNNTAADKGDIHVNADISYSANKLTLNADNDIHIDARINVNGSGTLALNHGNTGATGLKVSGQVNFEQVGNGLLAVNGAGYTVIKDVAALQAINNSDKSGHYALGGDVDASDFGNFTPIGGNFGDVFEGGFDGLGHSISGLMINSNLVGVGLFGRIENAVLRNVTLVGGSVTGQAGATAVGALVGGSLVWEADAGIFNVSASTAVQGARNVGGLVGSLEGGSIVNSHASGAVTGVSAPVNNLGRLGGLVGSISSSSGVTLSNVYASGDVTGQDGSSDYVGGLVGLASTSYDGALNISNGYATGNVSTAGQYAGGLMGGISSYGGVVRLRNLYASGKVMGDAAGGVIGFGQGNQKIELENAYWDVGSTEQNSPTGVFTDIYQGAFNGSLTTSNRYNTSGYAGFGTWTQASPGVWQARDADGTAQWIMVEGSTRPFLASEYSTTIRNAHQLQLTAYDLGASYRLAGDIDASATSGANASGMWSGAGFRPIGDRSTFSADNLSATDSIFTGSFEGAGKTISDLYINVTRPSLTLGSFTESYAGLFGAAGNGATISGVGLRNAQVSAAGGAASNFAGALVGFADGATVSRSHADGSIRATGGGKSYAGGLVGFSQGGGSIGYSYANADVYASGATTNNYAGGLVGWNNTTIRYSYATGNASATDGQSPIAGGLVGMHSGKNVIDTSYATGSASASGGSHSSWAGGLIGSVVSASIGEIGGNSFFATTDAAGNAINNGGAKTTDQAGVYWSNNGNGQGKTWDELMNPATFAGWDSSVWSLAQGVQAEGYEVGLPALIGVTRPQDVVRSTWFDGGWGTEDSAYGIADWGQLSNMRRLLDKHYQLNNDLDSSTSGYAQHASATANGSQGWQPIGSVSTPFTGVFDGQGHTIGGLNINRASQDDVGLFGFAQDAELRNVGLVGIKVVGSISVGGLVGYAYNGSISQAYATGEVNGSDYVGGLVGTLRDGSISQAYATGDVNGRFRVGGLVGYLDGGGISQAYATAEVNGSSGVGGLVGDASNGSISHAYYATTDANGNDINQNSSDLGTGTTLDALKSLSTFAGWGADIDDQGGTGVIWRIYDDYTTPLLRSFLKAKTVTVDATGLPTNLEYNGAVITGSLIASGHDATGVQGSLDSVLSYRTSSKNAGTYSTQDNSLQLLGSGLYSDQQGYDISYGLDAALVIQPKALVVSGTTVNGKTYDGNANAEVNLGTISGWVGEERLNIGVSGTFEDKNAGTGKHVDVAYTLSDGDNDALADNYRLTDGNSYTADIERKALVVSGITADNKTYDGSTAATVNTGGAQFDGLVEGDDLRVIASGQFSDKNAGQGKTVMLTSSYGGDDMDNYAITGQTSTTADIDRKALVITARDAEKTQGDAQALDGSTGFTHDDGLVAGETVDRVLLASAGTDAGAEAGAYDITASDARGSNGFDADNYDITYEKGTLTVAAKQGGGGSGNGGDPGNGGGSGNGDNPGNGGGTGNGDNPGNGGDSGNGDNPGNGGGTGNGGDPGNGGNPGNGGDSGNGDNPGNGGGTGNGNGDNPGNGGGSGNGGDPGNGGGSGNGGDPGNGGNPGNGGDSGNGDNPGNGGGSGNGGDPGNGGGSGNGGNPGNGGGSGNGGDPGNGGDSGNGGDPGNGGDSGNGGDPGNGGDSGNGGDPGNGGGSGNGGNPNNGNDGSSGNNAVDRRMPLGGAIWLVQKQQDDERLRRLRALSGNLLAAADGVPYLTLAPGFIPVPGEEPARD